MCTKSIISYALCIGTTHNNITTQNLLKTTINFFLNTDTGSKNLRIKIKKIILILNIICLSFNHSEVLTGLTTAFTGPKK